MPDAPDSDARLAHRLMALEESHTFLARTLDELSGEVLHLGAALADLARRVDHLTDRFDASDRDASGHGGSDRPGPEAPHRPGFDNPDHFGGGPGPDLGPGPFDPPFDPRDFNPRHTD